MGNQNSINQQDIDAIKRELEAKIDKISSEELNLSKKFFDGSKLIVSTALISVTAFFALNVFFQINYAQYISSSATEQIKSYGERFNALEKSSSDKIASITGQKEIPSYDISSYDDNQDTEITPIVASNFAAYNKDSFYNITLRFPIKISTIYYGIGELIGINYSIRGPISEILSTQKGKIVQINLRVLQSGASETTSPLYFSMNNVATLTLNVQGVQNTCDDHKENILKLLKLNKNESFISIKPFIRNSSSSIKPREFKINKASFDLNFKCD